MIELRVRSFLGDASVMPKLRKLFDEQPDRWEQAGNLSLHAQRSLQTLAAGNDRIAFEALERKANELRAEVAGPLPTPLEKLLADRIVLCWLDTHQADRDFARQVQSGVSLPLGDYLDRRRDRAHRRYLHAIRSLAQVRRLLGPSLQVNIADQQVNVVG